MTYPKTREQAEFRRDAAIAKAHNIYTNDMARIVNSAKKSATNGRNQAIYEARLAGAKYTDLSANYGISVARARQIFERRKRESERKESEPEISIRTRNCLLKEGISLDAKEVSQWSSWELLRIPNFGRVCLEEVQIWLKAEGLALSCG